LVRMEWRPAEWSVCLPLLIFPCTIKSRSSLLVPAYPGDPGKRAVKRLWCGVVVVQKVSNITGECVLAFGDGSQNDIGGILKMKKQCPLLTVMYVYSFTT